MPSRQVKRLGDETVHAHSPRPEKDADHVAVLSRRPPSRVHGGPGARQASTAHGVGLLAALEEGSLEPCDACGSREFEEKLDTGSRLIIACNACGMARLDPTPSPEELSQVYDHGGYYTTLQPRITNSLRVRIESMVLQAYWGFPSSMSRIGRALARVVLRPLKYRFLCFSFPCKRRLLDVGCGNGQRLLELQGLGCTDLYGLETTAGAAQQARQWTQARIFECELADLPMPDASFGVVVLNQVLEHVASPHATLTAIRRLLEPDGTLYLTVPNFASMESSLFGPDWAGLCIPEHRFHFSPEALTSLLVRTGYVVSVIRTNTVLSVTAASMANRWSRRAGRPPSRWMGHLVMLLLSPAALVADLLGRGQMIRICATPDREWRREAQCTSSYQSLS
jgi:2-polyprenyl-3-methyl-5-hydroxy-6-metoxy-1,4-benzoquinol methylase